MRLPCLLTCLLLAATGAAANEPVWTLEQRQAERDAVFRGRVESTVPAYKVEGRFPAEVWVTRLKVLDVRKGHPLLEAGPVVDVYYVRLTDPKAVRHPANAELAPGDEKLLFATARFRGTGEKVLFVELGSDVLSLPEHPGPQLRRPVPEVEDYFARHGIRLERFSKHDGQVTGYYVTEPATEGFRIRLDVWKFPADWTEEQIQRHVSQYSLGSLINGRYVLWCPSGENVDDSEHQDFERLRDRVVERFHTMEPGALARQARP